jgi:hypothetical protein
MVSNDSHDSNKPKDEYSSSNEIKLWLQNYGVVTNKMHKIVYSNEKIYQARCKNSNCSFKLKYRRKKSIVFVLKEYIEHDCEINSHRVKTLLSKSLLHTLYHDVDKLKPKGAQNQLLSLSGSRATYHQAYRAVKSIYKDELNEKVRSCNLIKPWLDWHKVNNQGSYS